MKKIFNYSVLFFVAVLFTFTSCEKKYEDGPRYSLRSAKARVSGDWKVEKIFYNTVDISADAGSASIKNSLINIEKDGKYTITGGMIDAGTWKLGEDKDDILFQSSTPGATLSTYRILKLKNKEMWWKQTQSNGDVLEIHLLPS